MKKIGLLIGALIICNLVSAQLAFVFDLGLVYPQPAGGPFHVAAAGLYLEPKVVVDEQIGIGLKLEMDAASNVSAVADNGSTSTTNSQMAAVTIMGTGDYYFSTNKVRPFAGGGLGYMAYARNYQVAGASLQDAAKGVGGMIRGGIVLGTFRLAVEHNFMLARGQSATVIQGENSVKARFWGLKLGWEIGGGSRF